MRGFLLSQQEIDNLVAYIRSLKFPLIRSVNKRIMQIAVRPQSIRPGMS